MASLTGTKRDKSGHVPFGPVSQAGQNGTDPFRVSRFVPLRRDDPVGGLEMDQKQAEAMGETWILFRPLPSDVPDVVRYRHLLKAALRAWGLKAVRVTGAVPAAEVIGPENASGAIRGRQDETNQQE